MNDKKKKTISKFLSLVLRHQPQTIGVQLDKSGWVSVENLLSGMQTQGRAVTIDQLREVVTTNEKKRFEFNSDQTQIRASQGHSVDVELGYRAQIPPAELLHGTVQRFVGAIEAEGLIKGNRHHVHLHTDIEVAKQVGERRGKAVILRVDSQAMHAAGFEFFISTNGVWLTDHVPSRFIRFPCG